MDRSDFYADRAEPNKVKIDSRSSKIQSPLNAFFPLTRNPRVLDSVSLICSNSDERAVPGTLLALVILLVSARSCPCFSFWPLYKDLNQREDLGTCFYVLRVGDLNWNELLLKEIACYGHLEIWLGKA